MNGSVGRWLGRLAPGRELAFNTAQEADGLDGFDAHEVWRRG